MIFQKKNSIFFLMLLLLAFGSQQVYFAFARIDHEKKQLRLNNHRLEDLLEISRTELRSVRIRSGELWAGELHQGDTSGSAHPVALTSALPNQKRISGEVALNGNKSLLARFELHECHPGTGVCTSGGSLDVLLSTGELLCSIPLSILSANAGRYEILWSVGQYRWSEKNKIDALRNLVRDTPDPTRSVLKRLVETLYQPDLTPVVEASTKRNLALAILRKALTDRQDFLNAPVATTRTTKWLHNPAAICLRPL